MSLADRLAAARVSRSDGDIQSDDAYLESGLSEEGRQMLAAADIADVTMAPAADMFELGVDLQVLKRGTMFAVRARKLHDLYKAYPSKPYVFPEWGLSVDDPGFIQAFAGFVKSHRRVKFIGFYNGKPGSRVDLARSAIGMGSAVASPPSIGTV